MKRVVLLSSLLVGASIAACVGSDPVSGAPDASAPPPDSSTVDAGADTSAPPPRVDAEAGAPVDAADAAVPVNPCPYSRPSDAGGCEPVCGTKFTLTTDIAPGPAISPTVVSVDGQGEGSYGLAEDGSFMFFSPGRAAAGSGYAFARKVGGGYSVVDIPAADLANAEQARAGFLTSDGLHVIFVTQKGQLLWGDADLTTGRVTFVPNAGPFSMLNTVLPNPADGYVSSPVLSGNGLVFTYSRTSSGAADGVYQSRRLDTSTPFPQPSRLRGDLTDFTKYSAIQALSYDGLTAFVFEAFTTRVFTRRDTANEFTTDLTRSAIGAWQIGVANRCDALIATRSPGGSQNQQIAHVVAGP